MRTKRYIKVLSLLISCLICLASLSSCALGGELRSVGKVGEYDVPYEELYFLANSYKASLEDKYGEYATLDADTKAAFDGELKELVYSNIVTNYAILSLCKKDGLTLDSDGVDERVDEYIGLIIESNFDGSKSDYKESMKAYYLTDHYVRFTSAVDILYSDFLANEFERSEDELSEEALSEIVKNEFARTWHIMIFNDEGESVEANRAKAEEALSKLRDGSMTMYKLIGSSYNEDLSLSSLDGIYFAKGTRDKAYESAAFALEVGGYSDVIELSYENPQGAVVSAFCILQRLEIEDAYVKQNFSGLRDEYVNSKISGMLDEVKKELVFEPNEYGTSLELAALEDATALSTTSIVLALVSLVLVAAVAVIVVIVIKKKKASE
ncbi:MAG: hypothetical protein IKB02_03035 [Clostridia bacterium]|nr:hypothetical protein [Clostridia bacterium]